MLAGGLLAACASEGTLAPDSLSIDNQASAAASLVTASTSKAAFNPFEAPGGAPAPSREVIVNPTFAEVMKTGALPERSMGRSDAPVTLVKYASMTCPYCRKFQADVFPLLKRTYIDTGKVRYVLREFPIGKQSGLATIALRCAPADKHFALYDRLMAEQPAWVSQEVRPDPIFAVASKVGMTRAQFDACRADAKLAQELAWVKDRGRTLGIIGTPNFFLNARLIKTVLDWPTLSQMIEAELAARGTVAGEPSAAKQQPKQR
jgi:protein-disulfide isomerase